MTDKTLSQTEIEERLWKAVEANHRTGMLGVNGDGHHFQPMTAFIERETNQIWFFAHNDSDLALAAEGGAEATYIVQTDDLWACIDGRLTADHDQARIDRFWNVHVAAWYPQGKEDPRLTLLRFDGADAGVWLSDAGPMKYAIEVAKANVTKSTPDIGEQRDINLH
jgi:general stress protein 26